MFAANAVSSSGNSTVNLGPHLILTNPLFADPKAGDYHLSPTSPAIGYGRSIGVTTDLDGTPRTGSKVDLGAYEFHRELYLPLVRR